MGGAIFDIEKFDGTGDFCLWKKKMKAIMMQLKFDAALEEHLELPATMTSFEKGELFKTAYSTIFLCLTNNVLRQVDGLETTAGIWKKLNELYLVKSLPNKIYLLEQFFGFKMDTSKIIDQNLDNFNKNLLDLGNSRKKFEDEDVSVILLNTLLDSFDEVITAIKYGRDALSISIVRNAIRSKEFDTKI
ncbi:hypothetical protein UlMin_040894 [Ulmus minor]